jgi:hypothetical protein
MGDGFQPVTPSHYEIYAAERRRLERPVAPPPPRRGPLFVHVSLDPEKAWAVVAPHVLYTTNSNAEWAKERGVGATPYPPAATVEDLKRSTNFAVVTPDECIALATALGNDAEFSFQPLMGGLDPDIAWGSLELFETAVLPRLEAARLR